jgi:hypothetical protein
MSSAESVSSELSELRKQTSELMANLLALHNKSEDRADKFVDALSRSQCQIERLETRLLESEATHRTDVEDLKRMRLFAGQKKNEAETSQRITAASTAQVEMYTAKHNCLVELLSKGAPLDEALQISKLPRVFQRTQPSIRSGTNQALSGQGGLSSGRLMEAPVTQDISARMVPSAIVPDPKNAGVAGTTSLTRDTVLSPKRTTYDPKTKTKHSLSDLDAPSVDDYLQRRLAKFENLSEQQLSQPWLNMSKEEIMSRAESHREQMKKALELGSDAFLVPEKLAIAGTCASSDCKTHNKNFIKNGILSTCVGIPQNAIGAILYQQLRNVLYDDPTSYQRSIISGIPSCGDPAHCPPDDILDRPRTEVRCQLDGCTQPVSWVDTATLNNLTDSDTVTSLRKDLLMNSCDGAGHGLLWLRQRRLANYKSAKENRIMTRKRPNDDMETGGQLGYTENTNQGRVEYSSFIDDTDADDDEAALGAFLDPAVLDVSRHPTLVSTNSDDNDEFDMGRSDCE